MTDIILALDIGTTKLCALALDPATQQVLAVVDAPNDSDVADLPAGRHEQNPRRIAEVCADLLRRVLAALEVDASLVRGIGISGQMHGVLLVDADGSPITNLMTWRDQRAGEDGFLSSLLGKLDDTAFARLGCRPSPGYGGATLARLVADNAIPKSATALSMADYVAYTLCGEVATEPTHAASWGIYHLAENCWDTEVLSAFGIPRKILPPIRASAAPLAVLTSQIQKELGLGADVRVCSPVGDNQASVIGAIGFSQQSCVFNLGTGGQVSVPGADFAFVAGLETRPMPLGGCIRVGASLCGGWAYQHLNRFFAAVCQEFAGVDVSETELYHQMNELGSTTPPDTDGLVADTRYLGSRLDPDQRGSFCGIGTDNLTPAHLVRAVAVGMVRELADMAKQAGLAGFSEVVATGNGVRRNPLVSPAVEDCFNLPCRIRDACEEAALGAALAAGVGLGVMQKDNISLE